MKNKKIIICLTTLLIISLITTGCGKKIEVKDGSKAAVTVKGGKLTATEYYNEIKKSNISRLVDMIDHQLLDEKYPTDETEDKEVKNQISQIKSNYGDNEEMFISVIQQYFGVSTEEELEEMLRLEYKRNKAVEDYIEKNLKDDEIQKYYEENIYGEIKASHILITSNVKDDATTDEKEEAEKIAKEEAKKIIKKLDEGEEFEKLAKKYSKDSSNSNNGGDLGYFDVDEMVEEFSNAAKSLKKNEYTKEPVKTEYGYHIILKTGQKEKPKLSEVKDEIKEKLREQKLNADPTLHYQTLIEIREENKIKWNDDELEKAYNDFMEQLIETAEENAKE